MVHTLLHVDLDAVEALQSGIFARPQPTDLLSLKLATSIKMAE